MMIIKKKERNFQKQYYSIYINIQNLNTGLSIKSHQVLHKDLRKAIRVLVTARVSDAATTGSAQLFAGGGSAAATWQNDRGSPDENPVDESVKSYHHVHIYKYTFSLYICVCVMYIYICVCVCVCVY